MDWSWVQAVRLTDLSFTLRDVASHEYRLQQESRGQADTERGGLEERPRWSSYPKRQKRRPAVAKRAQDRRLRSSPPRDEMLVASPARVWTHLLLHSFIAMRRKVVKMFGNKQPFVAAAM